MNWETSSLNIFELSLLQKEAELQKYRSKNIVFQPLNALKENNFSGESVVLL